MRDTKKMLGLKLLGWLICYLLGDEANDDLRHSLRVSLSQMKEDGE